MSFLFSALVEYYDNFVDGGLKKGFSREPVFVSVEIDKEGNFIQFTPLWEENKTKKIPMIVDIPVPPRRGPAINPGLFCDWTNYALGFSVRNKKIDELTEAIEKKKQDGSLNEEEKKKIIQKMNDDLTSLKNEVKEKDRQCHAAFIELHRNLPEWLKKDEGVAALLRFFEKNDPEQLKKQYEQLIGTRKSDGMTDHSRVIFRLSGDDVFLCQRPAVVSYIESGFTGDESGGQTKGSHSVCLVTGKRMEIARLHEDIKGVASTGLTSLVSFDKRAFRFFAKEQGENAPFGKETVYKYTTALNHLLSSNHHIRTEDSSIVFWSDRPIPKSIEEIDDILLSMMGKLVLPDGEKESSKHDSQAIAEHIQSKYQSIFTGRYADVQKDYQDINIYFAVFGAHKRRAVLRLFEKIALKDVLKNIQNHFRDTYLESRYPNLTAYYHIFMSLFARQEFEPFGDVIKRVPPWLRTELIFCIMQGKPYPFALYVLALERLRSSFSSLSHANLHTLVAFIKGYLIRKGVIRMVEQNDSISNSYKEFGTSNGNGVLAHQERKDFSMLDPDCQEIGYILGRLFALCEFVQRKSLEGRISDEKAIYTPVSKLYSAFSSTPKIVFPHVIQQARIYLSQFNTEEYGILVWFDKQITEIMNKIDEQNGIPARLSLDEQGLFALGYYHQKAKFYKKKEGDTEQKKDEPPVSEEENPEDLNEEKLRENEKEEEQKKEEHSDVKRVVKHKKDVEHKKSDGDDDQQNVMPSLF